MNEWYEILEKSNNISQETIFPTCITEKDYSRWSSIAAYSDKRPYCRYSGQCRYSSIAAMAIAAYLPLLRMKAAKTRYF